jgi:hypothetical protein
MSVQTPLLNTIEPDEDSPAEVVPKPSQTSRAPVVLTPTNRAAEGAMASNPNDAESGTANCASHLAPIRHTYRLFYFIGIGAIFRQVSIYIYICITSVLANIETVCTSTRSLLSLLFQDSGHRCIYSWRMDYLRLCSIRTLV